MQTPVWQTQSDNAKGLVKTLECIKKRNKSSKKNEKKSARNRIRSQTVLLAGADSTPVPRWQLAQLRLEVVGTYIFFYACTHARTERLRRA